MPGIELRGKVSGLVAVCELRWPAVLPLDAADFLLEPQGRAAASMVCISMMARRALPRRECWSRSDRRQWPRIRRSGS
jgi:hypothetical protein